MGFLVRMLVWFYQFFFWHCLAIVCPSCLSGWLTRIP
jgi:hypothetical protein